MRDKIYFAHHINIYNTKEEEFLEFIIENHFSEFDIENPNQKKHSDGYRNYQGEGKRGMDYFFEEVLPDCKAGGICHPFEDGMLGKGVFAEMNWLYNAKRNLWEISSEGIIKELKELDTSRELSVEETRKRVYPQGKK